MKQEEKTKDIKDSDKEKEKEKKEASNSNDFIDILKNFEDYLKTLKDIYIILTKENLDFLKKLSLKENIKINLLLCKIYLNIISNETLYNTYLISIAENDTEKIELLFYLIENCVSIVEKLNAFTFSLDLYKFKNKIISLIKCICCNCKSKIKDEEKLKKITELIETLPTKFFSNSFIELNKSKDFYEVCKTQEIGKINEFEEKFSEINNYFEQFDSFKRFVEYNSGLIDCSSVDKESIGKKNENEETKLDSDKIEFYNQYGSLILKFCKYHNYMFLDKEEEAHNKDNKEKIVEDEGDNEDKEDTRIIFLLDKTNKEKIEDKGEEKNEEKDKSKKIVHILKDKQFISSFESKEYKKLIKKEINYYLGLTKSLENEEKIKIVREHLIYYLSTLDIESYYPLYLNDFTKISINDNFTPSFLINVPARNSKKIYFETPENEDTLAFIECSLEDKTKDINMEINKYESGNNESITAFKGEKIDNIMKFYITCHGYSLYEIVFDNSYSWFNSKDINYRISFLKLLKNQKKDEMKEFEINGKKFKFNEEKNKIEMIVEKGINIPVILNLNNIKFVSFKNSNDKEAKEKELAFKEQVEEDEKIIPKHLFDYLLISHLKKIKDINNQKIIVNIFSQNRNLLSLCEELNEEITNANNNESKNYLKNIGFIPDDNVDNINFEYKLYDPNEQVLLYHIFLNNKKFIKSALLIDFDKSSANAVIYSNGEFLSKFKDKDNNFNNINIDNDDELLYIIKHANDNYEDIELVLTKSNDVGEENNKKLMELFEKIKKYCQEIINPPMKIYEYENKDICCNLIKNINAFYENN